MIELNKNLNKRSINNQDNNLVSVIIPCYNRSDLLRDCLESISNQTYKYIEVIVIDDASTDDLKRVIAQVNWPDTFHVIYIRLEENEGPGYAREVGRQIARGSFINYQDSDDLFHPQKIEKQVELLEKFSDIGMCYCITLSFSNYPFNGLETIRKSQHLETILPGVIESRPWATGSCLWTKMAAESIGPWIETRYGEDLEYDIRAGCKDILIKQIPEVLMYVRTNNERVSNKKIRYLNILKSYNIVLDDLINYEKIRDAKTQLEITKEIIRICRELFIENELNSSVDILHRIIKNIKPSSNLQRVHNIIIKIMIISNIIILGEKKNMLLKKLSEIILLL